MLKMKVLQFALYCCLINQLLWTEVSTKPVPAPEPFIDIIPLLLPFLITETIKLASDKSAEDSMKMEATTVKNIMTEIGGQIKEST